MKILSALITSVISIGAAAAPSDHFVTTWKTDILGDSNNASIILPIVGGLYNVDWDNDGNFDEFGLSGPVTHNFGTIGTFTIRIDGTYDSIHFGNTGDKNKILSIDQWGTQTWGTMHQAFTGCSNLEILASDTPDFSNVTSMFAMFSRAPASNPNTRDWDTSSVTNMAGMFAFTEQADPDTSLWDTSSVTDMSFMFYLASSANPDTSGWNTSAVSNMESMFAEAHSATPDTSNWDTSSVTNMYGMFAGAPLANPNTSNWDTSSVIDMAGMFASASSAKPVTIDWDTSSVVDMSAMFDSAPLARPDTSRWDVSQVEYMDYMFYGILLPRPSYEYLIYYWSAQGLQLGVEFDGGGSTYCSSEIVEAKNKMEVEYNWIITDGGLDCTIYPVDILVSGNLEQ